MGVDLRLSVIYTDCSRGREFRFIDLLLTQADTMYMNRKEFDEEQKNCY